MNYTTTKNVPLQLDFVLFAENSRGLLLATDVAARGLDIPGVEHVIHYQVPKTTEVCHFI